jgi:hypothetical protein
VAQICSNLRFGTNLCRGVEGAENRFGYFAQIHAEIWSSTHAAPSVSPGGLGSYSLGEVQSQRTAVVLVAAVVTMAAERAAACTSATRKRAATFVAIDGATAEAETKAEEEAASSSWSWCVG